jgi:uncharacterized protein (UPF0335 family)
MPIDPTDLYDQGLGADDNPPIPVSTKPAKKVPMSQDDIVDSMAHDIDAYGPKLSSYDPNNYSRFLPNGLYESNGNPDLQLGEAQSALSKWGNVIPQIAIKAGTQLVDMVGGVGSLLTEGFGDDRDYQNGFTEAADAANVWTDKNFPLYRTSQGVIGSPSDLGFWLQAGVGLGSSIAGFAVGGEGIAAGLGAIGKALRVGKGVEAVVGGLSDAVTAAKFVNKGEEALTAGMLAYSEAAQFGRQIYNDVYSAQIAMGKSEEEAKHMAAQSAATGVQLNTVLATGLNLAGGMGMFFDHEKDAVIDAAHKLMRQEVGEGTGEGLSKYITRLKDLNAKNSSAELGLDHSLQTTGKKLATGARQAFAEGMEEVTNQWAQAAGTEEGKKSKEHGFIDQLGLLSNYFDYTMNQEGALNFVLGAVAGPLEHVAAAALPVHKVALGYSTDPTTGQRLDKDGKPALSDRDVAINYYEKGKRVTSAKKNRILTGNFFENIRDRVVADAEKLQKNQSDLKAAVDAGDFNKAENLRHEAFDLMNLNSVNLGMGEHMKETYKSIAALDNTTTDTQEVQAKIDKTVQSIQEAQSKGEDTKELEAVLAQQQTDLAQTKGQTAAMKVGFASRVGDDRFIKKAERAVKDLEALTVLHDKVYKKYGTDKDWNTPEQTHVADFIYQTLADGHLTKGRLADAKAELEESDTSLDLDAVLDEKAYASKAVRDRLRSIRRLEGKVAANEQAKTELNRIASMPESVEKNLAYERVLDQYGIVSMEGETPSQISKRLIDVINDTTEKYNKEYTDLQEYNLGTPEFDAWKEKNPTGKTEDYFKQLKDNLAESLYQKSLNEHIGFLENKLEVLQGVHAEITKAPTLSKIMKNTERFYDKLGEKLKKQRDASNTKVKEATQRESVIAAYNKTVRERLQRIYTAKAFKLGEKLDTITKELASLQPLLNVVNMNSSNAQGEIRDLMKRVKELELEAKNLGTEIDTYTDYVYRLRDPAVMPHTPTPPPPVQSNPVPMKSALELAIEEHMSNVKNVEASKFQEFNAIASEIEKTGNYSLKSFVPIGISPEQSAVLVTSLKKVLEARGQVLQEIADAVQTAEQVIEDIPEEALDLDGLFENSPEDFLEPDLSSTLIKDPEEGKGGVVGAKQTAPASAGASKSTVFFEQRGTDTKVRRTSTALLEDTANTRVLRHDQLVPNPNVKLTISVDLDYSDTVNYTPQVTTGKTEAPRQMHIPAGHYMTSQGEVKSYLDEHGKIIMDPEAIGNMPIKIVHPSGETVQWLHSMNWVNKKDPMAIDSEGNPTPDAWYNVVTVITDSKGNVIESDNARKQAAELYAYRKAIAEAHNRGDDPAKVTVESKGAGQFIYAPGDGVKASTVLKESNVIAGQSRTTPIPMAIVRNGKLVGDNLPARIDHEGLEGLEGRVVSLVRMANGTRVPVALRGSKLSSKSDDTSWQAFTRILELYLSKNVDEVKILKGKGFEFETDQAGALTKDGFENFVTQYYTYFHAHDSVGEGLKLKTVGDTVVVEYTDQMGTETWTMTLGQLDRRSLQGIAKLFDNRYRAVAVTNPKRQMVGLNNQLPLKEFIYDDGKWRAIPHKTYNDFLQSHLVSPIVPVNWQDNHVQYTDDQGTKHQGYFFGVNPIVKYNMDSVKALSQKPSTLIVDTQGLPDPATTIEQVEEDDVLADLREDSPHVYKTVGTQKGPAVSLESLTEMYNFTPQSERNGVTPQEMMDYFRRIEVSHPPEGFNPFKRC